jgi:lycopene cyclase domain-containing protein
VLSVGGVVIGEYTAAAVAAVAAVITGELLLFRTGLLREGSYWATMAIVLAFQVLVDGWLTRSDQTVVFYRDDVITGVRWPWHIPIEDYGFGFALVTLTLVLWRRQQIRTDKTGA